MVIYIQYATLTQLMSEKHNILCVHSWKNIVLSILSKRRSHYSPAFRLPTSGELVSGHFLGCGGGMTHILAMASPSPSSGTGSGGRERKQFSFQSDLVLTPFSASLLEDSVFSNFGGRLTP